MDFEEAKFKAIKYLGISKKTEYEVIIKLKRLEVDENIIDKVIRYLSEFGYINDIDYVNSYIKQNERILKYSIYEIKEKLKLKGIKKDILENKLNFLVSSKYEDKIIEKIFNTKSKSLDENKIKQYLYRRGFKKN
ncbi:MAG: regulatory protein RecX [Clostridia bacterium]|nr:regulatory protein RecX [Clostridia bacterium]MDD4386285.1 regulatory protein RecX [Clostridia bacterium]